MQHRAMFYDDENDADMKKTTSPPSSNAKATGYFSTTKSQRLNLRPKAQYATKATQRARVAVERHNFDVHRKFVHE